MLSQCKSFIRQTFELIPLRHYRLQLNSFILDRKTTSNVNENRKQPEHRNRIEKSALRILSTVRSLRDELMHEIGEVLMA